MITKVFSAWTKLVEQFLVDISSETVPVSDLLEPTVIPLVPVGELMQWTEENGPKIFQNSQTEFYDKHKSEYSKDAQGNPFNFQITKDQLEAGFKGFYKKLLEKFPSLENSSKEKFEKFKQECLGESFHSLIADRAILTAQGISKGIIDDHPKILEFIINSYKSQEEQIKLCRESSEESLLNLKPASIPRGPGSPTLHKKVDANVKKGKENNPVSENRNKFAN